MWSGKNVPGKTRTQKRDYINSHGLGKKVHDFHNNVAKPALKRNVDFWKGVGTSMTTPRKRRGK